jgi:hypothetical protein
MTALVAALLLVAGCATTPLPPSPGGPPPAPPPPGQPGPPPPPDLPSLGWFSRIKVPDGHQPVLRLAGRGVQVFRCELREGAHVWAFRLPEAELIDERGIVVARHGANFSFEHTDGSRLLGTVVASDAAPRDDNLRWLLMSARAFGTGALAGISYVQRVNTTGGMPPARCEPKQLNQLLRVDFSADFVFWRPG